MIAGNILRCLADTYPRVIRPVSGYGTLAYMAYAGINMTHAQ